jgi:response regulator NasT
MAYLGLTFVKDGGTASILRPALCASRIRTPRKTALIGSIGGRQRLADGEVKVRNIRAVRKRIASARFSMQELKQVQPCKVLLVDDDRLVLATLGKGLEQAGYAVQTCVTAEEARRVLALAQPDIAVLDIRLPDVSGIALAAELERQRHVPFIFLTAYGDPETVREAAQKGALGYLVKPVDVSQLIPAIEAGLARAADLKKLRDTERQLQTALNENREISMAVGLLMERRRLGRQQAFELLRTAARSQRRKIADVAEEVLAAAEVLNADKTA